MEPGTLPSTRVHLSHERAPVHVTNATLNMNPECRLSAKSPFLLTKEAPPCYVGNSPSRFIRRMTTNQSQAAAPALRALLRTQDLSPGQRFLVELMHEHQFGRIENMPVRAGEPVFNGDVKLVRVARLGSGNHAANLTRSNEFDLKRQVRDLFEELERLQDGTVIRLEFRHGLPFLLETTPTIVLRSKNRLERVKQTPG